MRRFALSLVYFMCGCGAGSYPVQRGWESKVCGPQQSAGFENVFVFDQYLGRLEAYSTSHGHLPTLAGESDAVDRASSWRYKLLQDYLTEILPTIDEFSSKDHDLASSIIAGGKRWDSQDVKEQIEGLERINVRLRFPFVRLRGEKPTCDVLAVSGPGTAFELGKQVPMDSLDGDTILLLESAGKGRVWWQPQEENVIGKLDELLGAPEGISSDHPFGFLVGFKDGTIWRMSKTVPPQELRKFIDMKSARDHDRALVLKPWKYDLGQVVLSKFQ